MPKFKGQYEGCMSAKDVYLNIRKQQHLYKRGYDHCCYSVMIAAVTGEDFVTCDEVVSAEMKRTRRGGTTSKRDYEFKDGEMIVYDDWSKSARNSWEDNTNRVLGYFGYKVVRVDAPFIRTPITAERAGLKGTFILQMRNHVAAMIDSTVVDWTEGRRHRIRDIYKVVPENEEY